METMDKEAYKIKKDGMTRAERRAYQRNKNLKKHKNGKSKNYNGSHPGTF